MYTVNMSLKYHTSVSSPQETYGADPHVLLGRRPRDPSPFPRCSRSSSRWCDCSLRARAPALRHSLPGRNTNPPGKKQADVSEWTSRGG